MKDLLRMVFRHQRRMWNAKRDDHQSLARYHEQQFQIFLSWYRTELEKVSVLV
ncbi:hypothetical protein KAR91_64295 [Candidatus Pacearchaeota archaeon]|nr:hypothetical protein [Candidatus Pacearchaeota archaeon]